MFSTGPKIIFFDSCAVSELELGQDSLLGEKCVKAAGKHSFLFDAHNSCSKGILLAVFLVEEQLRMMAGVTRGLLDDHI